MSDIREVFGEDYLNDVRDNNSIISCFLSYINLGLKDLSIFTRLNNELNHMWVAKNRITDEIYSKKYSSIYDCDSYINHELRYLETFLELVEKEKNYLKINNRLYNGNRIIQCYEVNQNRWCDGFDF